jgi:predicted phage tail protein
MTAIYLHGAAGQMFGGPFHLDVRSPAEAFHALCRLKKGFKEFVAGADWRVIKGPTKSAIREDRDCCEEELAFGFGRHTEMHVVPVMGGAGKGKGLGKIVAGVAIIALGIFTGGIGLGGAAAGFGAAAAAGATVGISASSIVLTGLSIVLGGVSTLLAGNPKAGKVQDREDSTQRQSTLFNGPVNVGELGSTKPVVYTDDRGFLVGSVVLSAGLTVEQVPV